MEEKKKWKRTPAANQAQYRYNAKNIKRIPLDVRIDDFDGIKAVAKKKKQTVNGFIKEAIQEKIEAEARKAGMITEIFVAEAVKEMKAKEEAAKKAREAPEKPQEATEAKESKYPMRI